MHPIPACGSVEARITAGEVGGCRPLVCDHQPAMGCMTTDSSALVNTFTTCTFLLQWNIFIYITPEKYCRSYLPPVSPYRHSITCTADQ